MKNNELAEISIRLKMVIVTRDADFTHLSWSLMKKIKVIYVRLNGDPDGIAQKVLDDIKECTNILRHHSVVMLNHEGCRPL